MKKKVRLILIIAVSCCFFAFVYWVSYKWTYEDLQNNKLYDENQLLPAETTTDAYTPALNQLSAKTDTVTAKTTYILEEYDEESGVFTRAILPIPIELLGLDYEGLVLYTGERSKEAASEKSKLELVIFDSNLLVLRRTTKYICR